MEGVLMIQFCLICDLKPWFTVATFFIWCKRFQLVQNLFMTSSFVFENSFGLGLIVASPQHKHKFYFCGGFSVDRLQLQGEF